MINFLDKDEKGKTKVFCGQGLLILILKVIQTTPPETKPLYCFRRETVTSIRSERENRFSHSTPNRHKKGLTKSKLRAHIFAPPLPPPPLAELNLAGFHQLNHTPGKLPPVCLHLIASIIFCMGIPLITSIHVSPLRFL